MREMKFRAWDKKSKKFRDSIPVIEAWWDSDSWDDAEEALEDPYLPMNIGIQFDHRLVWQQYTGMMDGEEKQEIYEGDIVTVNNDPARYRVVFEAGAFGYYVTPYEFQPFCMVDTCCHTVVGNIFENPDMTYEFQDSYKIYDE